MRYLKATLIIGAVSALAVLLLGVTGWLKTADVLLMAALAHLAPGGTLHAASPLAMVVAALVGAFGFAWTTVDLPRLAGKFGLALSGGALWLSGAVVVALYGVFVSPVPAVLATGFSLVLGLFYGRSKSGARKQVLQRLFGQRLSRRQFGQLVDANVPLSFPGQETQASVVVCEVHNHVELLAALQPEDYVAMTNLYLKAASDYLVEAGGYLDECSGESLRVVFGSPLPREDHAVAACRAALELASRIENLNKECDARWNQRLDFRVGINSGSMIAAAYGGTRLGAFSVAGPVVEFARRLCAAGANYGVRILIGPETYRTAQETVEARPIDLLRRVDGAKVELYEVLSAKHGLSPERARSRDHFWRGVIYFRERRWDQAIEEFTKARVPGLPDAGLDAMVLRTERARRGEQIHEAAPVAALAEIN